MGVFIFLCVLNVFMKGRESNAMYQTRTSKRLTKHFITYILTIVLVMSAFAGVTPPTAYGASTTSYLAFTSDVHDNTSGLETWLEHLSQIPDYVVFGGDYSYNGGTSAQACANIAAGVFSGIQCVLAKGNHDTGSGYNEGLVVDNDNYAIYALDSTNGMNDGVFSSGDLDNLETALESVDSTVPFFIIAHHPIHYYGGRTTQNASAMIDLLNQYSNVIYLWGHNHSVSDENYGVVHYAGWQLQYTSTGNDKKRINFTYANAGCIYSNSSQNIHDAKGLLAAITKNGDDTNILFQYKNLNGTTVSSYQKNGGSSTKVKTYELATSVESGEKYVIVASKGGISTALTNTAYSTGGKNYLAGQTVTVSGSTINADSVTDSMVWTFTETSAGSGDYDVKNSDKYLTRTSGSAGLSTEADDKGSSYTDWSYASADHNLSVYSSNAQQDYYLYQAGDSSHYYFSNSSSASNGGTIYLYKVTETIIDDGYRVIYDGNGSTSGTTPADSMIYEEGDTITVLGNIGALKRSGYAFNGWNTAADGSGTDYKAGSTFSMGTSNITLYAKWKQVATVNTYELADSVETGATYVIVASKSGITAALTTESYEADGNKYLNGKTVTVTGNMLGTDGITADMLWTFTAAGSAGFYDVKDGDGNYLSRESGKTNLFTTATDAGSSATDWYYDNSGHNLYVNSSGSGSTRSYYLYQVGNSSHYYFSNSREDSAKGTIYLYKVTETIIDDGYQVTYDGNGSTSGTVPVDETIYEEGDSVTVLGNTGALKRSAHVFDGWNTAADGSGTDYDAGATFEMGTSNITLHAKWKQVATVNTYELANSVEDHATYVIVASKAGVTIALTSGNYSTGGTDYLAGQAVSVSGSSLTAGSVTDHMLWEFTTHGSGYFVQNSEDKYLNRPSGGQGSPGLEISTSAGSSSYSDWIYDNSGHNLYVHSSGSGSDYKIYQAASSSPYYFSNSSSPSNGGTIYLYKVTETIIDDRYQVTYDGNGSTSGTVPVDESAYKEGDTVTVFGNTGELKRSGYTFDGWNTAANGSGTDYDAGVSFEIGTSDVTLYAQWKKVSVDTSYEQADFVETGATYVIVASKGGLTTALTSGNYSTGGTGYLGGQAVSVVDSYVAADGVTADMLWTFSEDGSCYDVMNGGSYLTRLSGTAGLSVNTEEKDAPYTDWTYDGTNHDLYVTASDDTTRYLYQVAGSSPFYFSTSSDEENGGTIYLYKQSETVIEETYSVEYEGNGSTSGVVPVDEKTYKEGDTVTVLGNTGELKRSGFTFDGWNTAADGSGTGYEGGSTLTIGKADVILYAKWKKVSTGKTYDPVYSIEDDATYVIVSVGDTSVALTNATYRTGDIDYLEGKEVRLSGIYLVADDVTDAMLWKFDKASTGYDVKSGCCYLTRPGGGAAGLYISEQEEGPAYTNWFYDDTGHNLYLVGSDGITRYNLYQAADSSPYYFSTSFSGTGGTIYLYKLFTGSDETYTVKYDKNGGTGGSVPVDSKDYKDGDTVTVLGNTGSLTLSGYSFNGWNTVADGSGIRFKAGDSFIMGTEDMTLYAQWEKNSKRKSKRKSGTTTLEDEEAPGAEIPFADIVGHWAYDSILWAWEQEYMDGISKSLFDPDGSVTRAMFVTVLYRFNGEPSSGPAAFHDVPEGQWYTDAVAWASENGIAMGYSNGYFGVNDRITREQMAMMIYRYMQKYGDAEAGASVTASGYSDALQISDWAQHGVGYTFATGLMTGKNGNLFDPQGRATRAEVTAILKRISDL